MWLRHNGGASLIRRGGRRATVGFRLGSMLSFYVAAEDYIYGSRVEGAGLSGESVTQNDVQLAFGFGFPVGR